MIYLVESGSEQIDIDPDLGYLDSYREGDFFVLVLDYDGSNAFEEGADTIVLIRDAGAFDGTIVYGDQAFLLSFDPVTGDIETRPVNQRNAEGSGSRFRDLVVNEIGDGLSITELQPFSARAFQEDEPEEFADVPEGTSALGLTVQNGEVFENALTDGTQPILNDETTRGVLTVTTETVPVTSVTINGVDVTNGGTIETEFGILTVTTNGDGTFDWRFDLQTAVPHIESDIFTTTFDVVVTDASGATLMDSFVVDIFDDEPVLGQQPVVVLDDDVLPSGNNGGVGDDPDPVLLSGTLDYLGGADIGSVEWLAEGAPDGFEYQIGPDGELLIVQDGTVVLAVTLDEETGDFTITQNEAICRPVGTVADAFTRCMSIFSVLTKHGISMFVRLSVQGPSFAFRKRNRGISEGFRDPRNLWIIDEA